MSTKTTAECCWPISLDMNELSVVYVNLNSPPPSEIIEAILPELLENFEKVSAEMVQCPDLSLPPFNLAFEGLSGDEKVIDIGDINNLIPVIKREKLYNVRDLKQITGSDPLCIIGPCGGPYPLIGVDSECVEIVKMTGDGVENRSHILTSVDSTGECILSSLPNDEMGFSILANFFASNGLKGEVLKIVCEVRKGPLNFSICIREALAKHFGNKIIALGGVILMEKGKVYVHVVRPDLAKTPLESLNDFDKWLHFIELTPPSVGLGCIVSHDPDLNLRLEHFHLYTADCSQGGHYHYDTEPNTIKYTGYFSIAKQLIKIDPN